MSTSASLAFGFSSLVYLACEIAIVVVVATVVRRHRPDAHAGLLAWAIAVLVWSMLQRGISTVGPMLVQREGIQSLLAFQSALSVIGALVHVGLVVLFVRGLAKLAQPPKSPVAEPVGPYR